MLNLGTEVAPDEGEISPALSSSTMRSAYMGLGLYGFSGNMVNFWADPNGMGIYTIEYSGFKVNF